MKNSAEGQEGPEVGELLSELLALLGAHRWCFGQERTYRRGMALVLAEVFAFGRHTVTQLLLTLGVVEGDWSGWYRLFSCGRVQEEQLATQMVRETLRDVGVDEVYAVGTDGTQIPRSSLHMAGTSWLKALGTAAFRPGIHRAQRFVHGCWFTPLADGFSRAIPLRFVPAFPEGAEPAEAKPCKEWEAGLAYLRWLRRQLDAAGRACQRILYLADAGYENAALWAQLPAGVIGALRTAKNRALYAYLPPSERRRRRLYGPKQSTPAELWRQPNGWQRAAVTIRGCKRDLRYRIEGPLVVRKAADTPLYLLIVSGQTWVQGKQAQRRHRQPVAYLVSAQQENDRCSFPLPAPLLLSWLWQRWEMEVAHREMKSSLGIGEKQCWSAHSAILTVQWSVWVYAVLVLAGYRTWQLKPVTTQKPAWSPAPKRWSFNTLWRSYRTELWATPAYRAICSPTTTNWLDKETLAAALWNSVTAAARA